MAKFLTNKSTGQVFPTSGKKTTGLHGSPHSSGRVVNRTKRAKLNSHGFKTYKNTRVYIGESTEGGWSRGGKPAPRKEFVDMVREMWNNDPSMKAMRKHVKDISIRYAPTATNTGTWFLEKQKLVLNDNGTSSIPVLRTILAHEIIGHTFWDFSRKWRREELIRFNRLANETPPINSYVKRNEEKWRKVNEDRDDTKVLDRDWEEQMKEHGTYDVPVDIANDYQKKYDVFEERRKTNGHDTMTEYANEQHSAITEIMYGGSRETFISDSDLQKLIQLWKELHY